jgi:hypothetical protein
VISHSLVGASPDYVDRFFHILPGTFNPERYQPEKWAALARLEEQRRKVQDLPPVCFTLPSGIYSGGLKQAMRR